MGIEASSLTVYTVGHSNRSVEDFISLLQAVAIKTVVDVRAYPQSNRYPHFSQDELRQHLGKAGMVYHWTGRQLGGMRKSNGESKHVALNDAAMQAYADYMESEPFQKAIVQLINLASQNNTAILCAEKLPENCHRSFISDYLMLQGVEVKHILDNSNVAPHQLNSLARRESQELVYDRGVTNNLF